MAKKTGMVIEVPTWTCEQGHTTDTTIQFRMKDQPQEDFCAICWQDWLQAQGWKATRV